MHFTKEQDQAVHLFRQNILVSAGAGAGKTRVLVNRIAEMMMNEEHPVSADEFLVLTFTNAAAAEMKERITLELEDRLSRDPGNSLLRKQLRLIKTADVSTVHSFCNRLIHAHFEQLGLDPSFRIGEEGELVLMVGEVMEQVLEDAYQEAQEDFIHFVEAYAPEKNDSLIEDMILKLYRFSRGFPDANQWYDRILSDMKKMSQKEGLEGSYAMQVLLADAKQCIQDILPLVAGMCSALEGVGEMERYAALLGEDLALLEALEKADSYHGFYGILSECRIASLPSPRKAEKEHALYEEAKAAHSSFREEIRSLSERLFLEEEAALCQENQRGYEQVAVLIRLVRHFEARYEAKKREKNVYDFDDLEHFALKLLVDHYDEEGRPYPTATALEYRRKYKEIFVDEYQDTNLVQEALLQILAREGENHLFTVGDVKQSIYRFRMARPDLFLRRYEDYADLSKLSEEERKHLPADQKYRIELRDNFRSCPDVLNTCNFFFYALMSKDFGGLDYTDEVALRHGQGGPMEKHRELSEILLLVDDEEKENLDEPISKVEAEALMIGKRMKELVEEGYTYDDMVILLRSASGYAEPLAMTLNAMGIPAICDTQTGYFQTREIRLMMNYLSIVDNVYQDIPMASVLLSTFANVKEEELAMLKSQVAIPSRRQYSLYDLIKLYILEGEDSSLVKKLEGFMDQLALFRAQKKELPIGQLIWNIYLNTGFYYDVQTMPDGEKRKENLLMLLARAEEYEQTIYKGLFYFIRYMEKLRSYEIELATASEQNEGKAAVHIMTIHKSKGLEFPVVFVSTLAKQFNKMDLNAPILYHPELGIGLEDVDLAVREKKPSFLKNVIRSRIEKDSLEEELRVLYVAMTRAQRRLILTGIVKEKHIDDLDRLQLLAANPYAASGMLDWVLSVLPYHSGYQEILRSREKNTPWKPDERGDSFTVSLMHYHEIEEILSQEEEEGESLSFEAFYERIPKEASLDVIRRSFGHAYPYEAEQTLKRKFTVTELKKAGQKDLEEEEKTEELILPYEKEAIKPYFLAEEKKEAVGTVRGTIVHRIMELLPMGDIASKKDLYEALIRIEAQYPPCKEINMKRMYQDAWTFLDSELGREIARLDQAGLLKREIPFTVGIPVNKIYPEMDSEEVAVIQGVIDACCEAEDGLWLIDYKTDRIKEGEEQQLLDHYSSQMLYYKLALEQVLEKKVSRGYIYSFALGRFVTVF